MDEEQLKIWFAGFYEGEGSISNDIQNRNRIVISISQNDVTPLELGKSIWGGSLRQRTRITPSGKICHGNEWCMRQSLALKFIEDIKPFMIIPYKILQMENALFKMSEKWDRRFKCNFCNDDFSDPSGRRRHEKKCHIDKGTKYKCDKCDKEYLSKDSLNRHMKINHTLVASVCASKCDTPYNVRETP
jgi:transcription elongation factor Elf1